MQQTIMERMLEEILGKLLVPQTSVLQQASQELKVLFKKPDVVPGLCFVLRSSANPEIRSYAAVLLRRKVSKRRKWFHLSFDVRNGLKFTVIVSLQEDPQKSVKYSIAQLAGTLARHELPKSSWPELLQYLQSAVSSAELGAREIGIFALSIVASNAAEQLQQHLKGLLSLFSKTVQEEDVRTIPFYTIKALTTLACMTGSEEMQQFQALIPKVLQVIRQLVPQDEEKACEALQLFDELIECEVGIIAPHVKSIIEFCLEIAVNKQLGDEIRVKALTVVSWLGRLKNKAILKHKLVQPILKALFTIMFATNQELDDGDGCDDDDLLDGAESNSPTSVAAQVIDILALHLPAEKLMQPLMVFVEPALSSENPSHRKAAYITLAVTAEGCADHFRKKYLKLYLQSICNGIQDPHPFVRNAALFALGQFSEHLQPDIAKYASDLLPLLLASLFDVCQQLREGHKESSSCTKIFYALENFCESLDDGIVPYLPAVMDRLFDALSCSSSANVLELAVSAIGATANAATVAMLPYFNEVMSRLKLFLTSDHSEDTMPVKIQSLDTLGVLARTIGGDTFRPLVPECIQLGLSLMGSIDDPDLRRCTYGLFASISTVIKEEMGPYLPIILQHMINSLQSMDGVVIHSAENESNPLDIFDELSDDDEDIAHEEDLADDDDDAEENEAEDDDDDVVGFNVENAYLEEKEDTCSALKEMALNTRAAFLPFVEKSTEETYRLIDHPAAPVRKAAIEALGSFCCIMHEGTKNLPNSDSDTLEKNAAISKMASSLLSKLIVIITEDKERSVAMGALDVVNELVKTLQRSLLESRGNLHSIVAVIKDVMQSKVACQDQLDADGIADLADDGQQAEHDSMLIEYASDILPSLARVLSGPEFAPYFAGILPFLLNKTKRTSSDVERSFAIGTLAECSAAMEEAIVPFVSHILPVFLALAQDEDDEVRSNAIYGLGVLAEHGGQAVHSHYPSLLQFLSSALSSEKDPRATDNICGTVARMILAKAQAVPLNQVFPVLVQYLPLRIDFEENTTIFKCISYLFSLNYPQVLSHMPKILETVAAISHTEQANADTQAILDHLVVTVRSNFPEEFHTVLSSMSQELGVKLTMAASNPV